MASPAGAKTYRGSISIARRRRASASSRLPCTSRAAARLCSTIGMSGARAASARPFFSARAWSPERMASTTSFAESLTQEGASDAASSVISNLTYPTSVHLPERQSGTVSFSPTSPRSWRRPMAVSRSLSVPNVPEATRRNTSTARGEPIWPRTWRAVSPASGSPFRIATTTWTTPAHDRRRSSGVRRSRPSSGIHSKHSK